MPLTRNSGCKITQNRAQYKKIYSFLLPRCSNFFIKDGKITQNRAQYKINSLIFIAEMQKLLLKSPKI